ncbi:hypothetical protein HELRODRAFT_173784 [Helobdella robusta]|uniref:Transcriptional adapter 2-alpha/beta-like domain-containing protein n=1 Tax=Helobdella robusta TaxID=6412 RepID=T1F781_HELRO|nr:hypothetical protein HELRODRAFT_173784 [Helobdella robusta]ESO03480.1 hypothetical protein HELRODRAFT_173784 [Helobdella robusta]
MACSDKYAGDVYEKSVETQDLTVEQQKDLGYMALRDDFDKDYDNDAETSISSVCLHYTDDAIDVAYKVFQVEQFRERQMDRDKRKVLAKRYNILYDSSHLGFKSFRVNWKKRTREFKAYQNNFLSVAKFMDKSKFAGLFKNLERQKKICRHLSLLLRLSKNGLKKMTEKEIKKAKQREKEKRRGVRMGNESDSITGRGVRMRNENDSITVRVVKMRNESDSITG